MLIRSESPSREYTSKNIPPSSTQLCQKSIFLMVWREGLTGIFKAQQPQQEIVLVAEIIWKEMCTGTPTTGLLRISGIWLLFPLLLTLSCQRNNVYIYMPDTLQILCQTYKSVYKSAVNPNTRWSEGSTTPVKPATSRWPGTGWPVRFCPYSPSMHFQSLLLTNRTIWISDVVGERGEPNWHLM